MKSLFKALDILEIVMNSDGAPVTPSKAAAACGINDTTCVRIMGKLTERGYLEKFSRRDGYVPGPVMFALTDCNCFYGNLLHASAGVLRDLVEETNTPLSISVLPDTRRYILYHHVPSFGSSGRFARHTYYAGEFYAYPTDRLLMSEAPPGQVDRIFAEYGLPGDMWPEVRSRADLDGLLPEIRRRGSMIFPCRLNPKITMLGATVRVPGHPAAAIGLGLGLDRDAEAFMEKLLCAIEKIKENMRREEHLLHA